MVCNSDGILVLTRREVLSLPDGGRNLLVRRKQRVRELEFESLSLLGGICTRINSHTDALPKPGAKTNSVLSLTIVVYPGLIDCTDSLACFFFEES